MVVAVPVVRANDIIGVALTVSSTATLRGSLAWDLEKLAVAELAALILLVAIASRLASWVLKPVFVLDAAAHQISSGELSTRVSATHGPVELRRLATSFNGMAYAVENALERERAFVADASHQLRNPLAALTLRLEALGLDLDAARREELALVYEEAARLGVILDELLELATAQHVRAEPVVVELATLVTCRLDAWQPLAERRAVRLGYPTADGSTALIDPALVSSALDAVLDNAIKFSPHGGRVDVEVTAEETAAEPATVRIDVTDEGPGLDAEEIGRAGDRFWRSTTSQNVPGSGLGLSIARTLLDATGGRLGFATLDGYGLRVSLWLPRHLPASAVEGTPVKAEPVPAEPAPVGAEPAGDGRSAA
jgi:signal transduction histidine kinase